MSAARSQTTSASSNVDESALKCVAKALAARNVSEVPQFVGWLDKINQRDKKVLKRVLVVTRSLILSAKPDGKVAREGKLSELREVRAPTRTQLLLVHKQWTLEAESNNTPLLLLQLRRLCAHVGLAVKFDVCKDAQMSAASVFDTAGYSLREGYLFKQGGTIKNWKSRWFVLNGTSLNYFETDKDSRSTAKPLGSILLGSIERASLQACTTANSPPHSGNFCFQFLSAGRDWLFCATSQKDRDEWLRVIAALLSPTSDAVKSTAAAAPPPAAAQVLVPAYSTSMQGQPLSSSGGAMIVTPSYTNPPQAAAAPAPAAATPSKPVRPAGQQHQQLPNRAPAPAPAAAPAQSLTTSKMHFGIEKLQEMFPDEPPSVLQAALTSFNGDTQRAIDVLLQREQHRQQALKQPKPRARRASSFSGSTAPQVFTAGGQAPLPVFHRERSPSEIAVIMKRLVDADDDLADFAPPPVTTSTAGIHYEGLPNNDTPPADAVVVYETLPPHRSTSDPPLPLTTFTAGMATSRPKQQQSQQKLAYTTLPRETKQ